MDHYYSISSNPGTFGKLLYNAAFKELGIDAEYTPMALDIGQFKKWMDFIIEDDANKGVSVSMPFKRIAMDYCDYFDGNFVDRRIKNINTILIDVQRNMIGCNTDWDAIDHFLFKPWECWFIITESAIIYGNGAMAETISDVLRPDTTSISHRTISRKDTIKLQDFNGWECLINATPVGMSHIEDTVFTEDVVKNFRSVVDVVVSKEPTNLIRLAEKHHKPCVRGWEISLQQWKHQFEIYTDQEAPMDLAKKLLKENGYR